MAVVPREQLYPTTEAQAVRNPVALRRVFAVLGRIMTYGILLFWSFICLFPIYWTISTSFKDQAAVLRGPTYIPWTQYEPSDIGWNSVLEGRDWELFRQNFFNSVICALGAATLALVLGSLAGYGLTRFQYRFGPWRNRQITFWFLSQLILPPVAVVIPILLLYRELNLIDTRLGLILLYTVINLPIVIWIMRDQFASVPIELEQAALVDGESIWGAFLRIVLPIARPGMVAAFLLTLILSWNEYFFAAVLTRTDAVTLPMLVAQQVSSQGQKWWSMAAIASAAIIPLLIVGILFERFIVRGLTAGSVK